MSGRRCAANTSAQGLFRFRERAFSGSRRSGSRPGQRGKNRLRGVGDHSKKRARRPARHAFALLPVANSLDGNAEPGCEFELGQARAAAKIANGGSCRRLSSHDRRCSRRSGSRHRRRERHCRSQRKFPPVSQFDDPSVRFQSQALHVPPDSKRDSGPKTGITFADRATK